MDILWHSPWPTGGVSSPIIVPSNRQVVNRVHNAVIVAGGIRARNGWTLVKCEDRLSSQSCICIWQERECIRVVVGHVTL